MHHDDSEQVQEEVYEKVDTGTNNSSVLADTDEPCAKPPPATCALIA
jgi:hypothetical protein